jgi:hypothetical protein
MAAIANGSTGNTVVCKLRTSLQGLDSKSDP